MVVAETASVLGGWSVQGVSRSPARFGGVAILPYISFAVASLIIVRFFAKKLRMMSGFTQPDHMGAGFGSNFLRGLLRKCYYEPLGIARTETFYLRISRVSIVVVGIVSFLGALRTPELILNIVSYAVALVGVAFFFPMLFGLNSPYLSRRAAIWSSVAGSLVGLGWTVPHLIYAGWTRQHAPWILDIHPVVPGLIAAIIPIAVFATSRIEMSPKAMQIFFPERTDSAPSLR